MVQITTQRTNQTLLSYSKVVLVVLATRKSQTLRERCVTSGRYNTRRVHVAHTPQQLFRDLSLHRKTLVVQLS